MSELAFRVLASSVSLPKAISGAANQSKTIKQNKNFFIIILKTTTTIIRYNNKVCKVAILKI